jgi:carbonic anhydrase
VHGWVYSIEDGILKDLKVSVSCLEQIPGIFRIG